MSEVQEQNLEPFRKVLPTRFRVGRNMSCILCFVLANFEPGCQASPNKWHWLNLNQTMYALNNIFNFVVL